MGQSREQRKKKERLRIEAAGGGWRQTPSKAKGARRECGIPRSQKSQDRDAAAGAVVAQMQP